MSLLPTRQKVAERDRAVEQALGIPKNDPEAQRFAQGRTVSRADIEAFEREHTRFWRRKRRASR
jgi:hypothetical protein